MASNGKHENQSENFTGRSALQHLNFVPAKLARVATVSIMSQGPRPRTGSKTAATGLAARLPEAFREVYSQPMLDGLQRDLDYIGAQTVVAAGQGRLGDVSYASYTPVLDWLEREFPVYSGLHGLGLTPTQEIDKIAAANKAGDAATAQDVAKRRIGFDLAGLLHSKPVEELDVDLADWSIDYGVMYQAGDLEVMDTEKFPIPSYPHPFGAAFHTVRTVFPPADPGMIVDEAGRKLILDACQPVVRFLADARVKDIIKRLATRIIAVPILPGKLIAEIIDGADGGLAYLQDTYARCADQAAS